MTKNVIWIVSALGLLPAVLLSLGHVAGFVIISLSKAHSDLGEVGGVTVHVGPLAKLHMSTQAWPAVIVLTGVAAVVVGLSFLIPRQPDRIRTGGFSKMESYVGQLLASRKEHAAVIASTYDEQRSILIMRQAGRTTLCISADRTAGDGEETKIREFFQNLGMTPAKDYRSSNGGVPEATCNFEYQLKDDPKAIAQLCVSTFTNLFGVTDREGLEFITDGI